jgi:hypothetical protein
MEYKVISLYNIMSYIREGFQYTGRSVQLDPAASSSHVITLLDEYNERLQRDEKPDVNPFKERIIAQNDEGVFYEIPKDIQDHAIQLWIKTNKNTVERPEDTETDTEEYKTDGNSILMYIIILIAIAALGYYIVANCTSCEI